MALLISLLLGVTFGLGLILAGMTNPAKVLAYLDIAGKWDPALALVMGGAIGVAVAMMTFYRRDPRSPLTRRLLLAKQLLTDTPLPVAQVARDPNGIALVRLVHVTAAVRAGRHLPDGTIEQTPDTRSAAQRDDAVLLVHRLQHRQHLDGAAGGHAGQGTRSGHGAAAGAAPLRAGPAPASGRRRARHRPSRPRDRPWTGCEAA